MVSVKRGCSWNRLATGPLSEVSGFRTERHGRSESTSTGWTIGLARRPVCWQQSRYCGPKSTPQGSARPAPTRQNRRQTMGLVFVRARKGTVVAPQLQRSLRQRPSFQPPGRTDRRSVYGLPHYRSASRQTHAHDVRSLRVSRPILVRVSVVSAFRLHQYRPWKFPIGRDLMLRDGDPQRPEIVCQRSLRSEGYDQLVIHRAFR